VIAGFVDIGGNVDHHCSNFFSMVKCVINSCIIFSLVEILKFRKKIME